MKISKRQLRAIIRAACALEAETAQPEYLDQASVVSLDVPSEEAPTSEVPAPEDYDAVRDMLSSNKDLVDLGIGIVMDMSGASCERSTAQAIIDHLQDMLSGSSIEMPRVVGY